MPPVSGQGCEIFGEDAPRALQADQLEVILQNALAPEAGFIENHAGDPPCDGQFSNLGMVVRALRFHGGRGGHVLEKGLWSTQQKFLTQKSCHAGVGVKNAAQFRNIRAVGAVNIALDNRADLFNGLIRHKNQPFGRYASAQIEMKECRQTAAFLVE